MSAEAEKANQLNQGGRDIRDLRRAWVEAFNLRDVEGVVSFYAEDAVELPLSGAPVVNGTAAIRELVESMFAAGFREMEVQQTQVGYTEPLAVELATYSIKPPNNKASPTEEKGRLVATWRRVNGQFKITISVWSREMTESTN